MDAAQNAIFERLVLNLEELTKIYSQLLDVVRHEQNFLLQAHVEHLNSSNESKEVLIRKARLADELRQRLAQDAARIVGAPTDEPRLLEIAKKVGGLYAGKLRSLHAGLETLLGRLAEQNRINEEHAQSALRILNGAMGEIKETIAGKKTYGGKGQYKVGPETTGHFIRKEV
jgi:flagellar biosynthesis/type III secretory pathway chaperone